VGFLLPIINPSNQQTARQADMNFASLTIGDKFKFKPSTNDMTFIKLSNKTAKTFDGKEFKCSPNSLVEKQN
jgi:hypothetical protein